MADIFPGGGGIKIRGYPLLCIKETRHKTSGKRLKICTFIHMQACTRSMCVRSHPSGTNMTEHKNKAGHTLTVLQSWIHFINFRVCNSVHRHAVSTTSVLILKRCRRCIPFRLEAGTLGTKEKEELCLFFKCTYTHLSA